MMEKIKTVIKAIWAFVAGALALIVIILAAIFGKKIWATIVKVWNPAKWQRIPGSKNTIVVDDGTGKWIPVELPYSTDLRRQITADDIQAVGLSDLKGGVDVEIKHSPVDRHGRNGSGDMSIK